MIKRELHWKTQDDQSYGSVRLCCNQCGILVGSEMYWTESRAVFENPPYGYIQCDAESQAYGEAYQELKALERVWEARNTPARR